MLKSLWQKPWRWVSTTLAVVLSLSMPVDAVCAESPPQVIARGNLSDPLASGDGNDVAVLWADNSSGAQVGYLVFSRDGGKTFTVPMTVISDEDSVPASLVVASGHAHICSVRSASGDGGNGVYYTSLDFSHHSAALPRRLSADATDSRFCRLYAAGSHVLAVWEDVSRPTQPALHFAYSSDDGTSFRQDANLAISFKSSEVPAVALSPTTDVAYVAWPSDEPGEAGDWVGRIDLSTMQIIKGRYSKDMSSDLIATEGQAVFVIGEAKAYVSVNDAARFAPVDLPPPMGVSLAAEAFLTNPDLVAVAFETVPDEDVFLSVSTDQGGAFSSMKNMSEGYGNPSAYDPQFLRIGKMLALSWTEVSPDGSEAIAFRVSSDNARNFGSVRRMPIFTRRDGTFGGARSIAVTDALLFFWGEPPSNEGKGGALWFWRVRP